MTEKPVRDHDKFMLRMPDGLRERIAGSARVNGRSMNSEIVATLLDQYPDTSPELQSRYNAVAELAYEIAGEEKGQALVDLIGDLLTFVVQHYETPGLSDPAMQFQLTLSETTEQGR